MALLTASAIVLSSILKWGKTVLTVESLRFGSRQAIQDKHGTYLNGLGL